MIFAPYVPPSPAAVPPARYSGPALAVPMDFGQACQLEPGVCGTNTSGAIPPELRRALRYPAVTAGGACPVSPVSSVAAVDIPLPALGGGRVRALLGVDTSGVARTGRWNDHWAGAFKAFWVSEGSYQGPFRVRGARVDGPGDIGFGFNSDIAEVVVPSGPTHDIRAGYRLANTGISVTTPGCYALQVDGTTFSDLIVFRAVAG